MATFFYRQKHSRRRLAALNFLSNISLDGSCQGTKFTPTSKVTLIGDSLESEKNLKEVSMKSKQPGLSVNDTKNSEILCTVAMQDSVCDKQVTCSNLKSSSQWTEEKSKTGLDVLMKIENPAVTFRERSIIVPILIV